MRYQVLGEGPVVLEVFDMGGQKIKTLVHGLREAGVYQVSWNGRNEEGKLASSGVYLARLQAGQGIQVRKLMLIK